MKPSFLIVGGGMAGLSFALKIVELGNVLIFSKTSLPESNSSLAQGGIASVLSLNDTWQNGVPFLVRHLSGQEYGTSALWDRSSNKLDL